MKIRIDNAGRWSLMPFLLLALLSAPGSLALNDSDVRKLSEECEAAREVALAPIREQRTEACIEQQLRSPGHCERYYSTYGNASAVGSFLQPGYFYDLPECVEWMNARDSLKASRSRS